jgi:hypothetical protein
MTCSRIASRPPWSAGGALVLTLLAAAPAIAGPTASDAALAETLFREGRTLMSQKRYSEACPKLQESQRLDPSGGTLLNLAACHEAEGKLATAWVEYKDALAIARRDHRTDREKVIRQKLKALEPRVPHLTVVVKRSAQVPGLALRRDEVQLAPPTWGVQMPVDPGTHTLVATAPGRKLWETSVTLVPGGSVRVEVPEMPAESVTPAAPVAASPVAPAAPVAVSPDTPPAPAAAPTVTPSAAPTSNAAAVDAGAGRRRRVRTVWSLSAGGVGVALLAVGSAYGLMARSKNSDSQQHCRTDVLCNPDGVKLRQDALDFANVATWLYVAGGVALATGVALWFVLTPRKRESQRAPRVTLVPALGPGIAALQFRGSL